jgi:hypothetical protein
MYNECLLLQEKSQGNLFEYQCERYDDHNAYMAPWMPNASANGRVLDMLFDCFGSKEIQS